MDDSFWWLIVGLALFVVELLTPGFVVACFGVGALLASLIAGGIVLASVRLFRRIGSGSFVVTSAVKSRKKGCIGSKNSTG